MSQQATCSLDLYCKIQTSFRRNQPHGNFSLPWTSVEATLVGKQVIDKPENYVECEYKYYGITNKEFRLKVGFQKPEMVDVQCIKDIQQIKVALENNANKGSITKALIDNKSFNNDPKNIIFIDNSPKNIDQFMKEFENGKKRVFIYHYPLGLKDKPCS